LEQPGLITVSSLGSQKSRECRRIKILEKLIVLYLLGRKVLTYKKVVVNLDILQV